MKQFLSTALFCCLLMGANAQTLRMAILDFENSSGKKEYDAFGKALSNMLISDLKNNIHPNKVLFFERSQLLKLLEEQRLQKSKNFDPATAVAFGKISGVNYVLTGTVFVLDGNCTISSRMVQVQTSKIIIAKEASGRLENWLQLKTKLAEDIAMQLNQPLPLADKYKKQPVTTATLNQYGKILNTLDEGDIDKAAQLSSLFEETNSEFPYFKDIQADIEKIKQRVSELENINKIITNAFELGDKAQEKSDHTNAIRYFEKFLANPGNDEYAENKKLYALGKMAQTYFKMGDHANALLYAQKAQAIYPYYPEANEVELMSLMKLGNSTKTNAKFQYLLDSLNFQNEYDFQKKERNPLLRWENTGPYSKGLKKRDGEEEEMFHPDMVGAGYRNPIINEIKLIQLFKTRGIDYSAIPPAMRQFQKLEKALLALANPDIFASDQMVNYFRLSLQYADDLWAQKKYPEYKAHLAKEIKRMDDFGNPCTKCNTANKREVLSFSADKEVKARYDSVTKSLYQLGLSNSLQDFYEGFNLVYGEFVFRQLILHMQQKDIEAAARLYNSFLTVTVTNRNSFFYNYYWDILLQLRKVTKDFESRSELSSEKFNKALAEKITRALTEERIPLQVWEEVKNYKVPIRRGTTAVELDAAFSKNGMEWSKNLGLVKDSKGVEFRQARTEKEMKQLNAEKVPAFAYYDYDENNGEAYGKLYNIYALKLIAANPPAGWRMSEAADYFKLLQTGKAYAELSEEALEELTAAHLLKVPGALGGYFHGDGFDGIDEKGCYWTLEKGEDGYSVIISIFSDGEMGFEKLLAEDMLFAVRLLRR